MSKCSSRFTLCSVLLAVVLVIVSFFLSTPCFAAKDVFTIAGDAFHNAKDEIVTKGDMADIKNLSVTDVERLSIFDRAAGIADAGRTDAAVLFIKRKLLDFPASTELVNLLFELYGELCSPDSALSFIGSNIKLSAASNLFFLGEASLSKRDFVNAAERFRRAADEFLTTQDTLSAAFSTLPLIFCDVSLMKFDEALKDVNTLKDLTDALSARFKNKDLSEECYAGFLRLTLESRYIESEYLNASDRLDDADSLYRSLLDKCAANDLNALHLKVLLGYGRLLEKRELLSKAQSLYKEAVAIAETMDCSQSMAVALNNLGQVELRIGEIEAGRGRLMEAKSIAESCGTDWLDGYIYYGIASSYEIDDNRKEALKYFLLSESAHKEQGNLRGELGARLRVAYVLFERGEYGKALDRYNHCIVKYEEMGSGYGLSWALGGKAICEHNMGMFAEAERDYIKCLKLREKLGDRHGAAWALSSLGMIYDLQGAYSKALASYYDALKVSEDIGDWREAGKAYFGIGSAYYYLGALNKSIDNYRKAFEFAVRVNDKELQYRVASGLGAVYSKLGHLSIAEGFFLRCLNLSKDMSSSVSVAWTNMNLASLYIKMGHMSEAKKYLTKAGGAAEKGGFGHIIAQITYLASKLEVDEAKKIEYLKKAAEFARVVSAPDIQWNALSDLGEIYTSRGDKSRALGYQEKAISIVDRMVGKMGLLELKSELMASSILPFERAIKCLLESVDSTASDISNEDVTHAFDYLEREKRLSIEALLASSFHKVPDGAEGAERGSREADLRGKLSFLQSKLQDPLISPEEWKKVNEELALLERELRKMKLSEALESKEGAHSEKINLKEIQSKLYPDEVVLSYFLSDDSSFLFVLKKNGLDLFRLKEGRRIEEKVKHFLEIIGSGFLVSSSFASAKDSTAYNSADSIQGRLGNLELPREVFSRAAASLYDELLGAATDSIPPRAHLIIIPDKSLTEVPFSILMKNHKYLIEDHAIYYAPSVQSLIVLREREKKYLAASRRNAGLLDMAAFGCVGADERSSDKAQRFFPFTNVSVRPLKNADIEARNVTRFFAHSEALTGDEASEAALKGFPLVRARIVHIASHCYISNEDVRRSFIVMNRDTTIRSREDGILQWDEILGLKVHSDLVALSGCRSAKGAVSTGMGVEGLSNAFIYAGANCVLASLFDVPDIEASRFMQLFYTEVAKGLDFADALRFAKLKAIRSNGRISSPTVWGSFVLIGEAGINPQIAIKGRAGKHFTEAFRSGYYILILLAVALLVLILLKYYRV